MHIVEGLDKAPEALPMLYTGGNTGKLLVHFEAQNSLLPILRYPKCHKGIRRDREGKIVNFFVLDEQNFIMSSFGLRTLPFAFAF